MQYSILTDAILSGWRSTTNYVANGHAIGFAGKKKEDLVLLHLTRDIELISSNIRVFGPEVKEKFDSWYIDLVCESGNEKIAIEGKFKTLTDGAVPDNRKEAFFDLFKLEQYVSSKKYTAGLFLWLTNEPHYLRKATGDSSNFSTHQGRVYKTGVPLTARRSRRADMPLPLTLTHSFIFDWLEVTSGLGWHSLVLEVN